MSVHKRVRDLKRAYPGWTVSLSGGGHLVLSHPEASKPVYTGLTPSDRRSDAHVRSDTRRALREGRDARAAAADA